MEKQRSSIEAPGVSKEQDDVVSVRGNSDGASAGQREATYLRASRKTSKQRVMAEDVRKGVKRAALPGFRVAGNGVRIPTFTFRSLVRSLYGD